jgi:hypothetical protein
MHDPLAGWLWWCRRVAVVSGFCVRDPETRTRFRFEHETERRKGVNNRGSLGWLRWLSTPVVVTALSIELIDLYTSRTISLICTTHSPLTHQSISLPTTDHSHSVHTPASTRPRIEPYPPPRVNRPTERLALPRPRPRPRLALHDYLYFCLTHCCKLVNHSGHKQQWVMATTTVG